MSIYEKQGRYASSEEQAIEELMQKQQELQNLQKDHDPSQTYIMNMGPQHPSTHGVFRAKLTMNGEKVVGCQNVCGYLHRGIEKLCEDRTWAQVVPYTDRLDYLSCILNEWGYCMAVEQLMGVEVPERGEYVRVIIGELQRIAHHLVYLACMALDFNGYTVWMYMFREREKVFDHCERFLIADDLHIGVAQNEVLHQRAVVGLHVVDDQIVERAAGEHVPTGFKEKLTKWLDEFPDALKDFDNVLNGNEIFLARTKNVGVIDAEMCRNYGVYGANLRAAGAKIDLRKDKPYSVYDRFDFDVPTGEIGDCYDRYMVRYWEMAESAKIIRQALEQMPDEGPTMGKVPKMIKVPAGSAYAQLEGGMGWLGFYVVSDGGTKPYRVRIHAPSMMSVFALQDIVGVEDMFMQDYVAALASVDIVLGEVDR